MDSYKYWTEYKPKEIVSKPSNGWANFIFNEDMRISYIDYMPLFVLEKILNSINNNETFCVSFDAEGYEYTILSYDNYDVEVIMRKDDLKVFSLDCNLKEFFYDFLFSIEKYLKDWAIFPCEIDISENPKDAEKLEKEIVLMIEKIKKDLQNSFWY